MSLLDIIRFSKGFLRIKVNGDGAERFLNLCSKNKIALWNIKRNKEELLVNIKINDYKRIRTLRKTIKFPPKIKIYKKYGMPFIINSYNKRKGIAVGIILSLLILYFLTGFIWEVKVEGNKNINSDVVISACEELGVRKGIRKNKIDPYNLKSLLVLKVEGIAWCSFNVEGSVLTVDISEAKDSSKETDKSPSSLISTYDGVIKSTKIEKGIKMVDLGQAVRKGDLLVSGAVNYGEKTDFVKSEGSIIAETERDFTKTIPLNFEDKVLSGKSKTFKVLDFFGLKIPLFIGSINFDYEETITKKSIRMLGANLPVTIVSKKFDEIRRFQSVRTEEEAVNEALCDIAKDIKNLPIISLKITDLKWEIKDDAVEVYLKAACNEDIAKEEKIIISGTSRPGE